MHALIDRTLANIGSTSLDLAARRFGRVVACDGGLIEVSGLGVPIGTICSIAQGQNSVHRAETIGFRNGHTMMMMLGDTVLLRPGAVVRPEGMPGMLSVGTEFLGRAVDGSGEPIDGGAPVLAGASWPAGGYRVGALDRSRVTEIFDSGIRSLNALTTFGIGQRVGIMAGSGVGKSVLMDMIVDNAKADAVVVGLIGERAREVSDFVTRHMAGERAAKTAIVAVPADHAANLRLRGAMLATSIAEHLRSQGKRVLLILDSLTRVAHAAREIGILLGEPGAARGYPPSALSTITKLIERAGNSEQSGGAITGVYTVLADGDDQNDPVVDTARAILDGHIVLSRDLAQRGQYPAVDVGASLSRVMNDIVPPEHATAARRFRALSASYEANRDLVMMGAYRQGSDPLLDEAIAMHPRMSQFLSQGYRESIDLAAAQQQLVGLVNHDA
ncbi:FliI/YscN family ATPase [Qipengyuania spongiae]|uniref:Flagellum-specific ATP synthase n=1 Tax=Qipengyuania spongiae TaxID=2909673 RepID=A0ABY5SZ78_9SPHN|nr:FliI/YscN family ATPase [Qipengyuania spongiae]UVI39500.1 FliI/YscN family ATPase [Qipengyuania spongiae]